MLKKLLLGLSFAALAAYGQSGTGGATLNGTVTDQSGAVVATAKVKLTQSETGFTRTGETNGAGLYSFSSVPIGTYEVAVEKTGFSTAKATNIRLEVGAVAALDIKLAVGSTADAVTVSSDTPLVETTRSATSTVITAAQVAELPVNGRNIMDVALASPGVVRDPTRGGDFSFGGQRGTSNSLQVDGSDANNTFFGQSTGRAGTGRSPYSFSQDAIAEFQVSTNTYAAEIGRAGGGVVSVVTKSGTNQFHGTIFEFFRDKALNANSWENNRIGAPKKNYHFNQFGGNLGGPIKKDKLFFFFDYDGQRNNSPVTVIPGVKPPSDAASLAAFASIQQYITSYAQSLNNNVYLGKVDWNISDKQRLGIRYNANRFTGVNYENGGQTSAVGHTGNASVTTDNISGTHNLTISPATLLESRFTFTRDDEPGEANSTAPEVLLRQGGSTVISFGRNNFSPRYTNAKTYQFAETLSHVRGNHSYKMGADLIWQRIGNFFPGNFSGAYTYNSYADFANNNPFSFTQAFAGAGTDGPLSQPNSGEYGFYAQDSWRVTNRLTLNYGVRYDLFDYTNPKFKNPDPGLAAIGVDTSRIPLDANNFAGRFGFAYRVSDSGNLTVRGGIGTFYGRTPSILNGTAFTQNGVQVQTYTLLSNIPTYPAILTAPPTLNRTPDIYAFDANYVQPITHQWSLNIERQLGKDWSGTLGYLGVRGEHLTRTRDINLLPEALVTGSLASGTAVSFYRHTGRANPAFGRISIFDSGADSSYNGVFLQVTKRFSEGFSLQAAYTLSKVIDDKPDFTSVVVGTDDSKNAQDTLNPNAERGRGNADIRNRFVINGLWKIDYASKLSNPVMKAILRGYQLSLLTTVQSGRPLTATVGGDVNNDGTSSTDRYPGTGRGTYESPGLGQIDLRVSRQIQLYKDRAGLQLIFEAFNLANRTNYNGISTGQYGFNATTRVFTPTPSFLTPTSTYDPRILQLAAKITF